MQKKVVTFYLYAWLNGNMWKGCWAIIISTRRLKQGLNCKPTSPSFVAVFSLHKLKTNRDRDREREKKKRIVTQGGESWVGLHTPRWVDGIIATYIQHELCVPNNNEQVKWVSELIKGNRDEEKQLIAKVCAKKNNIFTTTTTTAPISA